MKHTPLHCLSLHLSSGFAIRANLGHSITRSSTISDLADIQIDLSRKYCGIPDLQPTARMVIVGINGIETGLKLPMLQNTGTATNLSKVEIMDTVRISPNLTAIV